MGRTSVLIGAAAFAIALLAASWLSFDRIAIRSVDGTTERDPAPATHASRHASVPQREGAGAEAAAPSQETDGAATPPGDVARHPPYRPPAVPRTEAEWALLPLDRNFGDSLGREGVVSFNDTLRERSIQSRCKSLWRTPPPGVKWYQAEYEVRLEPVDGGWVVSDVLLHDANVSEPEVERCYHDAYVGARIPVAEFQPARAARVVFRVGVSLQVRK